MQIPKCIKLSEKQKRKATMFLTKFIVENMRSKISCGFSVRCNRYGDLTAIHFEVLVDGKLQTLDLME